MTHALEQLQPHVVRARSGRGAGHAQRHLHFLPVVSHEEHLALAVFTGGGEARHVGRAFECVVALDAPLNAPQRSAGLRAELQCTPAKPRIGTSPRAASASPSAVEPVRSQRS